MANISSIKLPNGFTYDIKDNSKSTATNWLNGSSTGSLRTIGSAVENSNYTIGQHAVAEGYLTIASGDYSHAEGYTSTASGWNSHAEGLDTTASSEYSHAEGGSTTASGNISHAEGYSTIASGTASHAEGEYTKASGADSHTEGFYTIASGSASHAQNSHTIATENDQTAIGRYNAVTRTGSGTSADPYVYSNAGDYAFIIGNGTDDDTASRSNALTVDWNGNVKLGNPTNNKTAGITVSNNATSFDIGWNWANRDGALLALRSVDYTTGNEGAFALTARDGTQSVSLSGNPNGTLTWGGTNVSLQGHTHTNPMSVPTQQSVSFKATAANTWQYTGLSFTIPSGHQYLARPWMGWNSGKPTGVGFETSTAMGTKGFPTYNYENANGFYTPPVFLLPAGTFYLFEKRASAPTAANTNYVSFVDLVCYGSIT